MANLYEGIQIVAVDPSPPVGSVWYNTNTLSLKENLGGGATGTVVQSFFSSSFYDNITSSPTAQAFTAYTVTLPSTVFVPGRVIQFNLNGIIVSTPAPSSTLTTTIALLLNGATVLPIVVSATSSGGSYFNGFTNVFINTTAAGNASVTVANGALWANGAPFPTNSIVAPNTNSSIDTQINPSTFSFVVTSNATGNITTLQGCFYQLVV